MLPAPVSAGAGSPALRPGCRPGAAERDYTMDQTITRRSAMAPAEIKTLLDALSDTRRVRVFTMMRELYDATVAHVGAMPDVCGYDMNATMDELAPLVVLHHRLRDEDREV